MADIRWIKITTDVFDDEKIRLIETLPEADTLIIIWFKLLAIAGKCNDSGLIYLAREIPYNEEMLSTILRRPINIIRLALEQFIRLQMIEIENNFIAIINWEKHQNIEGMEKIKEQNKIRQQKHRSKQKLLSNSNVTSRDSNALDKEYDQDNDYKQEKNIYIEKLFKIWIENNLAKHSISVVTNNLKKKHFDTINIIIKNYDENIWEKMIKDYATVLHSNDHFYNYTFTLWDFIARGYKKFLPELEPVKNFLDKKSTVDIFDYEEMPDAYDPTREEK